MTIDWINFTPWQSLAGGLLIGIAASLLILADGRIAGISGIIAGILRAEKGETWWRVAFVAGSRRFAMALQPFHSLAEFHFDSVSWAAGACGPSGRIRQPSRFGMHQRAWRVRPVAPVETLTRRHHPFYRIRRHHRLDRPSLSGSLTCSISSPFCPD